MKTKNLKQTVTLNAPPLVVYNLLMNAKQHAKLVGGKVSMSTKPKGKFNVFDGYCTGYNIELMEGKKIVQAWHFKEEGWPDNHYSICTFTFSKFGKQTKLLFVQQGIPEHKVEALKDGWKTYYWTPMKQMLNE